MRLRQVGNSRSVTNSTPFLSRKKKSKTRAVAGALQRTSFVVLG